MCVIVKGLLFKIAHYDQERIVFLHLPTYVQIRNMQNTIYCSLIKDKITI